VEYALGHPFPLPSPLVSSPPPPSLPRLQASPPSLLPPSAPWSPRSGCCAAQLASSGAFSALPLATQRLVSRAPDVWCSSSAAVCSHRGGGPGCPRQVPGCVIFRRSCLAWVHRGHQAWTGSMDAAAQALCSANCACTVFCELCYCSN